MSAPDMAARAQKAGEAALEEAYNSDDFDGCPTCTVRTVLEASWAILTEEAPSA